MDYTAFLQSGDRHLELPWTGGPTIRDDERSYRLTGMPRSPGWYRFRIRGRRAEAVAQTEPVFENWTLRQRRGYLSRNSFVDHEGMQELHLLPRDEPPARFAPVHAVIWFDGNLLYAGTGFETEVELAVRDAYEQEHEITQIKGVTPPLAQAFLMDHTERALRRLAAEEAAREAARAERVENERQRIAERQNSLEGRLVEALHHSGAALLDWRRGRGHILVRYQLGEARYECLVDPDTLRIIDAGICLEGADDALNLSSLPSAVQEAIATDQLVVTRNDH